MLITHSTEFTVSIKNVLILGSPFISSCVYTPSHLSLDNQKRHQLVKEDGQYQDYRMDVNENRNLHKLFHSIHLVCVSSCLFFNKIKNLNVLQLGHSVGIGCEFYS